jgi:hypothetical protein
MYDRIRNMRRTQWSQNLKFVGMMLCPQTKDAKCLQVSTCKKAKNAPGFPFRNQNRHHEDRDTFSGTLPDGGS